MSKALLNQFQEHGEPSAILHALLQPITIRVPVESYLIWLRDLSRVVRGNWDDFLNDIGEEGKKETQEDLRNAFGKYTQEGENPWVRAVSLLTLSVFSEKLLIRWGDLYGGAEREKVLAKALEDLEVISRKEKHPFTRAPQLAFWFIVRAFLLYARNRKNDINGRNDRMLALMNHVHDRVNIQRYIDLAKDAEEYAFRKPDVSFGRFLENKQHQVLKPHHGDPLSLEFLFDHFNAISDDSYNLDPPPLTSRQGFNLKWGGDRRFLTREGMFNVALIVSSVSFVALAILLAIALP